MNILTINAGSSSVKYKLFTTTTHKPKPILSGLMEGIGETQGCWHHFYQEKNQTACLFTSHQEAFAKLAEQLKKEVGDLTIDAIGHRIVHGGSKLFNPTLITPTVLDTIKSLSPLAPLHNPVNAQGVEFAQYYFPNAKQVAIFDTGFHHTIPECVHTYAIERTIAQQHQIRRYGFHGINHEYVAKQAAYFLKKPLDKCSFITLHLGNGASACLIKKGQSIDTSMGMTPLPGLIMGSRCGDIDPAIVLYLQRQGVSLDQVDHLLNKKSGLIGIAQENDMRRLLARVNANDDTAKLAINMYVYAAQKMIGGYLSQVPSLDALIFTGGIGENAAPIREKIVQNLTHIGFILDNSLNTQSSKATCRAISSKGISVLVIKGDEEQLMAELVVKTISTFYQKS